VVDKDQQNVILIKERVVIGKDTIERWQPVRGGIDIGHSPISAALIEIDEEVNEESFQPSTSIDKS